MSRRVLIVDDDVDALGALASALRARGLDVAIASEIYDAVEQAYLKEPHVMLAARELDREGDLSSALAVVPTLADLPVIYLVRADEMTSLRPREVRRTDVDRIAARILEVALDETGEDSQQEIRGNVQQMSLVDLLQLLTMNHRSGVLSVETNSGSGEVWLSEGQVVDATYGRAEGEKALFRMLGEPQGHFVFAPGVGAPRKIATPTNALLMEAMRQIDEVAALRKELSPAAKVFLSTGPPSRPSTTSLEGAAMLEREVVVALQVPRSLEELCDELTAADLEIVGALSRAIAAGKVEALPLSSFTAPLSPPEQLSILRALVTRLSPKGFSSPPRLVIAASAKKMLGLSHAVRYIEGVMPPREAPPKAALPRSFGTLRLGEGVELLLYGLPVEETFAALWGLSLPGAAAVVRIDRAGGGAFVECCEEAEARVLEAEQLVQELDSGSPAKVAALVRSALEAAAGV